MANSPVIGKQGSAIRWAQVWLAAAAMVGTLLGRTQGLGLITEPLIKSLRLDRALYAELNLWATLIGALFAIGIGKLIDKAGSRVTITSLVFGLGLVTVLMSGVTGLSALALYLTLTRGLGQGALSVASQALVGKWFSKRLASAMAAFSVILSIGFMAAFPIVGEIVQKAGWRVAWANVGWALVLFLTPLCFLGVRSTPESIGLSPDEAAEEGSTEEQNAFTLLQAVRSPAFWAVGLCSSAYGLIASGIGLFNENILAERGIAAGVYYGTLVITALTSLIGNYLGAKMTTGRPVAMQMRVAALAMLLMGISLLALTQIRSATQAYALAVTMGIAGGMVIVVFFAFWGHAFGRQHLGRIQGVAQSLTVLASAVGPLMLARVAGLGSYANAFYALALLVFGLGIWAWFVPAPKAV
jgi:MFS family permease